MDKLERLLSEKSKQELKEIHSRLFEFSKNYKFLSSNLEFMLSSDSVVASFYYYEFKGFLSCLKELHSISDSECLNLFSWLGCFYADLLIDLRKGGETDEK